MLLTSNDLNLAVPFCCCGLDSLTAYLDWGGDTKLWSGERREEGPGLRKLLAPAFTPDLGTVIWL